MDAWELPGSPTARRALIYGTAAKVGARLLELIEKRLAEARA
jgi:hypothetical protein